MNLLCVKFCENATGSKCIYQISEEAAGFNFCSHTLTLKQ